ncbi:CAP domain-containing protein [Streptomyces rectiverticillatus]|uniref:CAP domain-containing protein n=1 Tax=Streptomyces rectiverticillatus TaxID=173860 RepID=UPI0015C30F20|nr:CAP domain-containing protein [Streptomyces rectiverticillatus]QLE70369.1 CAP domain-containing protein [Streptomyces rectiverticillatus]
MNRELETPMSDPASDGTPGPRRRRARGKRPRRALVIGGTVGLIAVVGGGYGVAQSLSGGGETRTGAAAPSAPATDRSTEPLKEHPSVAAAASSAPSASSASPSAGASASAAAGKDRDQEKKDRAGVRTEAGTEAGDKPGTRSPAKAEEAPSTGHGSGNGSSSARKPPAGGGGGGGAQAGGANAKHVQQVVSMVNAERAKAGCSPLTINAKLQAAAQGHSDDMAARDYYDHTSPEGKSPGDRMTAAGYRWSTYGENIFKSPKDARTAMDGWMKSPGHRANILNCSFKEIGVGINFKSNGPWWTQNFGASS